MKKILAAFAGKHRLCQYRPAHDLHGRGLALASMLRESFPQFSLDMISIQVAYPGADPEEVEEGISPED